MPSEIRGRRRQSQAEATAAHASAMALLQGPGGLPASDATAIQRGVAALSTIVGTNVPADIGITSGDGITSSGGNLEVPKSIVPKT